MSLLRLVLKTKCLSWLFFLFQQVLLLFQTPIKCFTLLFRYMALGIALRYVLDALRKPFQSKMYLFGITALDRFRMRYLVYNAFMSIKLIGTYLFLTLILLFSGKRNHKINGRIQYLA